jgi:VIT1/CCC1 family predicted Fe2+/Mn2+ transporter
MSRAQMVSAHDGAERHLSGRAAWLRAAVLGANDGLVSTASLIVGVAAADTTRSAILVAGIAGLTAGALSMAAGEYVSVSSQLDTERADLERERAELAADPEAELDELAAIYEGRGLRPALARQVAVELSAGDRLAIHARDELGVDVDGLARPVQASAVSALSFVSGALLPVLVVGSRRRRCAWPPPSSSPWRGCSSSGRSAPAWVAPGEGGARCGCASGGRWRWPSPWPSARSPAPSSDGARPPSTPRRDGVGCAPWRPSTTRPAAWRGCAGWPRRGTDGCWRTRS